MKVTLMSGGYKFAVTYENVALITVEDCETFRVKTEGNSITFEEVETDEQQMA